MVLCIAPGAACLHMVLAVETIQGVNGSGTVEAEIRYFLSGCRE